jgi:hypothetical protein
MGGAYGEEERTAMTQHSETPVTITSARTSHSDDIHRRQGKYLLSMAVRTICFILAVVLTGPLRWVMVGAAVFLPYVAVVVANVSNSREGAGPDPFADEELPRLTEGPGHRHLE